MRKKIFLGLIFLLVSQVALAQLWTEPGSPMIINTRCNTAKNSTLNSQMTIIGPNGELFLPLYNNMQFIGSELFTHQTTFTNEGLYTATEYCDFNGVLQKNVISINVSTNIPKIKTTSLTGFNYEYSGEGYNAYFKTTPTAGPVVRFNKTGVEVTFQPMALQWSNDLSQIQQIQMISAVTGVNSSNKFIYPNAYGTGANLSYVCGATSVKEALTISTAPTAPPAFIISGGNPVLQLAFILSTNSNHLVLDGADWDKRTDRKTYGYVSIKDDSLNTLYQLSPVYAKDANGATILGHYIFTKSGNNLMVSINIPYSWINNVSRAYPIIIDPTVELPDGTIVELVPNIAPLNLTAASGLPVVVNTSLKLGNSSAIVDAECELDIVNTANEQDAVHFRSLYNNDDGSYTYTWTNPTVGNYRIEEYCTYGDILNTYKVFANSTVIVT